MWLHGTHLKTILYVTYGDNWNFKSIYCCLGGNIYLLCCICIIVDNIQ